MGPLNLDFTPDFDEGGKEKSMGMEDGNGSNLQFIRYCMYKTILYFSLHSNFYIFFICHLFIDERVS